MVIIAIISNVAIFLFYEFVTNSASTGFLKLHHQKHCYTHRYHQTVLDNSYGTHWQVENCTKTGTLNFFLVQYSLQHADYAYGHYKNCDQIGSKRIEVC